MVRGFPSCPIDVIDARTQGVGIYGIYGIYGINGTVALLRLWAGAPLIKDEQ
jgi:hypothetical protein